MKHFRFLVGLLIIFLFIGGYFYTIGNTNGDIEPLGRLAFVKFQNPDMYPGHPHSKLLARYAEERNSKCALVVHFAGSSNYRHYQEGNVTILELAFIDKKGPMTRIDLKDVLYAFIFGIPDDQMRFKADGIEFNTSKEAFDYIDNLAKEHGQKGPIPVVYHGTVREGDPVINQGCGFSLYYYMIWKKYGRIAAYYYFIEGALFPYFKLPTRQYELQHAKELQNLYNSGKLNTKD